LADNISFSHLIVNMQVDKAGTHCIYFSLPDYRYWRVRAIDFDGYKSAWSQIWRF
jgi:hypothetical protein